MVEGVPIIGLTDTGSDITIMKGDQFYDMTCDQKPITLGGQIDVKIAFGRKTIVSTVFAKLVAPDKLLLSQNVC